MTDETAETPIPLAVCGRCRQAYNAHVPTPHNRACREFRPLTVEDLTPEERARVVGRRLGVGRGESCPIRPYSGDLSCVRNAGHRGLHRNFQGIEWRAPAPEAATDDREVLARTLAQTAAPNWWDGDNPAEDGAIGDEDYEAADAVLAAGFRRTPAPGDRIASDIAASFPLNGELRHDGTADPVAAAYVEGLHDAWQIARAYQTEVRP